MKRKKQVTCLVQEYSDIAHPELLTGKYDHTTLRGDIAIDDCKEWVVKNSKEAVCNSHVLASLVAITVTYNVATTPG